MEQLEISMNKKIIIVILIILLLGVFLIFFKIAKKGIKQNEEKQMENIKVIINNIKYNVKMEDNETAKAFMNILPKEFNMHELNGNEKYIYMDISLPTNIENPKQINKGDIMLYGSDCLVVFYKSFTTNYKYTKIGHIDNLPDLENDDIIIKFEKSN